MPDELIFGGWFDSGEIFRSGCCWYRGAGKIFYFQPGHETNKSFECFHSEDTTNDIIKDGREVDEY